MSPAASPSQSSHTSDLQVEETEKTSDQAPRSWQDWWGAFARGLFHASFLTGIAAGVWQRSSLVWVLLVIYVVVVGVALNRGSTRTARLTQAFSVLVALVATAAAVVWVPLEVFSRILDADAVDPSASVPLTVLEMMSVCGLVAGGLLLGSRRRTGRALPVSGVVMGAATLVPVLLLAILVPVGGPLAHRTTSDPGAAPAIPTDPQEEVWEWSTDSGGVHRVLTGSHGPVLALSGGLVGLDGADGQELWALQVTHQETGTSGTFGQGRSAFHRQTGTDGRHRIWALDTATGELEIANAPYVAEDTELEGVSEQLFIDPERPDTLLLAGVDSPTEADQAERTRITVTDTRIGEEVWTREAEEVDGALCHFGRDPVFSDEALLVARVCAAPSAFRYGGPEGEVRIGFSELDPLTGRTLDETMWEHEERDAFSLLHRFRVSGIHTVDDNTLLAMEDEQGFVHVADVGAGQGRTVRGDFSESTENSLVQVGPEELVYEGRRPLGVSGEPGPDVVLTRVPLDGEPSMATTIEAPQDPGDDVEENQEALVTGHTGLVVWPPHRNRSGEWELHSAALDDQDARSRTLLTGTGIFTDVVMAPGALALALGNRVVGIA
ncbi:PQQ-binding-like beta-propeller repeat protein [Nocardiopsis sp. MG754419]|uniref:PQQ-binding-like beta-propeller repeat protein n=1 Tax=Nocardiopsis sp. MG754419 TaxID=2259865 RepID=UPI001BA893B5|nr:PQQ-binding-like beta-propeller repeat protein [Nocardiopsis sp. MG754419]MBR8743421.1 hypothetical protein [Nocardiopsis sp. MG754419]